MEELANDGRGQEYIRRKGKYFQKIGQYEYEVDDLFVRDWSRTGGWRGRPEFVPVKCRLHLPNLEEVVLNVVKKEEVWVHQHYEIKRYYEFGYWKRVLVQEIKRIAVGEAKQHFVQMLKTIEGGQKQDFAGIHLFRTEVLHKPGENEKGIYSNVRYTGPIQPDSSLLLYDHQIETESLTIFLEAFSEITLSIQVIDNPSGIIDNKNEEAGKHFFKVSVIVRPDHYFLPIIKGRIQEETGHEPIQIHLLWEGKELVNNDEVENMLRDEVIQHGSVLQVWVNEWVLHIQTLRRKSFPVVADPVNSVYFLKGKVGDALGFPANEIILVLMNGIVLDSDSATLESYGLSYGCSIYVTLERYNIHARNHITRQSGCSIDAAEYRGITLGQLREVATAVLLRCHQEGWCSTNPRLDGKRIYPSEVTLHDLVHYFVLPVTIERKCSYVEVVAQQNQTPEFFCSHWWGDSVLDFVACLEGHAFDRNLPKTTPYWVCAYSINQHDLSNELQASKSPRETPFYRAMQLTKGTVSIVDADTVCFSRIWCAFELAMVFTDLKQERDPTMHENYVYDIYTVTHDQQDCESKHPVVRFPVGLTDGLAVCDEYSRNTDGSLNFVSHGIDKHFQQFKRQLAFPLEIVHGSFNLRLENAQASREEDRRYILNTITDAAELRGDPPKSHEAYDNLNATIRGRFSESAYRAALERGATNMSDYRQVLSSAPFSRLAISFAKCKEFRKEVNMFFNCLPRSLIYLDLVITGIEFEKSKEFALGLGRLSNLQSLAIDASGSRFLDCNCLWLQLQKLPRLNEICLIFPQCRFPTANTLSDVLGCMPQLEKLVLDFKYNSVGLFDKQWCRSKGETRLRELELNLMGGALPRPERLWDGIGHLTQLKRLSLSLSVRSYKLGFANLAAALRNLSHLSCFSLCMDTTSSDERGMYVGADADADVGFLTSGQLFNLKSLHLDLYSCWSSISIRGLINGFLGMPEKSKIYDKLALNFRGSFAPQQEMIDLCRALVEKGVNATDFQLQRSGAANRHMNLNESSMAEIQRRVHVLDSEPKRKHRL